MLRHLRLARARGSLKAPNHPVQDRALEILEVIDEIAAERRRFDMVKAVASMGTAKEEVLRVNFPEYFKPVDPWEEARDEDGGIDPDRVDEGALDWSTPASPDDDDEISRWIREAEQASMTVSEMDQMDSSTNHF